MAALRENYWILKSRRTIKRILKTCILCQRFSVKKPEIPQGTLPEDRVKNASIFEVIGVDVAGSLISKDNKKIWIALFACAIYRAVHLELLMSLSTDNFILALKRFISRRGRPTKSIPPGAPWWGGFWKRLIGLLKRILRKVLGRTSLDYQEIETVLCDCESLLNSRPLTYVSDDPNDLCPLTPDLFLKEIRNSSTRDLDKIKFPDKTELNKRLAYRRRLVKDLRVRFRNEYLTQLLQKMRLRTQKYIPEIGDIVLISNGSLKRIDWPLELDVWQVVNKSRETIDPGGNSEKLDCVPTIPDYVPIVPDSVSTVPDSDVRTTRSGRNIRTPNRYRT
ncbi:integrase catalytic domain-containing protein [Trichonephila clavipes]|nr:integrase catalytic domain-containing protein [Trichonephila clavipes]